VWLSIEDHASPRWRHTFKKLSIKNLNRCRVAVQQIVMATVFFSQV